MNVSDDDRKVMSDANFSSTQRSRAANRGYCSYFWVIFEAKSKFVIICVRFILDKVGNDGFTGPQLEIVGRYEYNFKLKLMNLRCKQRLLRPFLSEFPSNKLTRYCLGQIDIGQNRAWRNYWATMENWRQIWVCLHLFKTKNKPEFHKKVCENEDFCNVAMLSDDTKTEFNQYSKSNKAPFITYADLEYLIRKIDGCNIIQKNHLRR